MENWAKGIIGHSVFLAYLFVGLIISVIAEKVFHIDVQNSFLLYINIALFMIGLVHSMYLGLLMKMDISFEEANKIIFREIAKYFKKIRNIFSSEKDLDK